jgi:hypothetical protein
MRYLSRQDTIASMPELPVGLVEALDPYIVLGAASRTDGAVAGERDAMVALRCAADQPVVWHRQ